MKKKPKIPLEEFKRCWNAGELIKQMAKKFGVSTSRISQYAQQHRDVCPKRLHGRRSKIIHTEFVEMWRSFTSDEEIAERFGISVRAVLKYAARHRGECPKRRVKAGNVQSRIVHKEFVKLWANGLSVREMAKRFGVCKQRVSAYAKLHRDECPKRELGRKRGGKIVHREFVKLWNSGVSKERMAEKFCVSRRYIDAYARMHDKECKKRKEKKKSKVPYEDFARMWNDEISAARIAEHFGISVNYVYNYVTRHREMGLKSRNR